jgi:hypothetical protein
MGTMMMIIMIIMTTTLGISLRLRKEKNQQQTFQVLITCCCIPRACEYVAGHSGWGVGVEKRGQAIATDDGLNNEGVGGGI